MTLPVGFLVHPGLLWLGIGAAAVPIIIHLLSRRRVRRVPWAAMEWLLAAVKRHQRRLRVENWLVLLLRVAALALLGLGLARWVLADSRLATLLQPKKSVVLLLDTSYSTGAKDGARTVFDRVRDEAERVLASLGAEDTVAVVVSNDVRPDRTGLQPAVLAPRTLGRNGVARAREAVAALRPTEAAASWPEALLLAVSPAVAPPDDVNRTLFWITDLQARDWRRLEDPAAPDPFAKAIQTVHRAPAAIRVIDASSGGGRRNLGVADVRATADHLFEGQTLHLDVDVWNHGRARVAGAQVRAFVDGSPVPARTAPVGALDAADPATLLPGRASVSLSLPKATFPRGSAGSHEVRVEIAPPDADASSDVLALDSERRIALDVRAQLRIAAWTRAHPRSKTDPRQILRGIFVGESSDVYDLRFAEGESALRDLLLDPAWEPDVVVLANTAPAGPEAQRALVSHVRGGGALLVFVGDQVTEAHWNEVAHRDPETRLLPFPFGERREVPSPRDPGTAWTFDLARATAHPLSKKIAGPENDWLRQVPTRIWGRMPLLPDSTAPGAVTPATASGDDERVVLRFQGTHGEPGPIAIAEGRLGQGRALWVGTAIDDWWLDSSVFFLPVFLTEAAVELTRQPERSKGLLVGGRIAAPIARDSQNVRMHVPGRGSEPPRVRPQQTETDRPVVLYDRTGVAGSYRLSYERAGPRGAGTVRVDELFAVNPDPVEGDLRSAPHGDVESRVPGADLRVFSTYEAGAGASEAAREGELSPYVLLAVVLLLLAEVWLAMRFNRHGASTNA